MLALVLRSVALDYEALALKIVTCGLALVCKLD